VRLIFFLFKSAFRLNNRGLTFANRCFAFAPAPSEAEGENYGANCNQGLFHEVIPIGISQKVLLFFDLQLVHKSHTGWAFERQQERRTSALGFIL
jgi:hypothetical protein